jgi:Agrobacterium tumefaciens protein Atu4866
MNNATAINAIAIDNTDTGRYNEIRNRYAGVWVTRDGRIRHELLPDGRYVEARGARKNAYQGRYWLTGDHIDYQDDTGFTADGEFRNGILHHAGMILYRQFED